MKTIDDILSSDDLRSLAGLGILAAGRGMERQAAQIFAGLRAMRPRQEVGIVGGAIVDILAGCPERAVTVLEQASASASVQIFLGIALIQQGDSARARRVLQAVADVAPSTPFGRLAQNLLLSQSADAAAAHGGRQIGLVSAASG